MKKGVAGWEALLLSIVTKELSNKNESNIKKGFQTHIEKSENKRGNGIVVSWGRGSSSELLRLIGL